MSVGRNWCDQWHTQVTMAVMSAGRWCPHVMGCGTGCLLRGPTATRAVTEKMLPPVCRTVLFQQIAGNIPLCPSFWWSGFLHQTLCLTPCSSRGHHPADAEVMLIGVPPTTLSPAHFHTSKGSYQANHQVNAIAAVYPGMQSNGALLMSKCIELL